MKVKKFDKDRLFFTSDPHFGHTNIIKFCNRPFKDVEEMNESIIENWNNKVGEDDDIIIGGDLFFHSRYNKCKEILERLNGKKYLVYGNHDIKNYLPTLNSYFEEVSSGMYITTDKIGIYISHFPLLCFPERNWNLFGHVHLTKHKYTGSDKSKLINLSPNQYDIGCDLNNYTPISYNEVAEKINKQIECGKNTLELYSK